MVDTRIGQVKVYKDFRVYVYDEILDGEPLFEREIHAPIITRSQFTNAQWELLSEDEKDLASAIEISLLKLKIDKLKKEKWGERLLFIVFVSSLIPVVKLFWDY